MKRQLISHLSNSMQTLFHFKPKHFYAIIRTSALVFLLIAAGCAQSLKTPTQVKEATMTAIVDATLTHAVASLTPAPLSSPTPAQQAVILVAPPGSDQTLAAGFKTVLDSKATGSGLSLTKKESIADGDLQPEVRLVVVLPPDPGLAAMAAAHPHIQFVGVEINGLQPAANLSLVGMAGTGMDQQAFLAGYLAALMTPDWRVGVINPADDTQGALIRDAFKNGARYFCGLCRPAYPPFVTYPQSSPLDNPADQASWQAAADNLLGNSVQTVFVPAQLSTPELIDYLDRAKVNIIGEQIPSGQKYGHWLASIHQDAAAAMDKLWPDLIAGKGGASLALPFVLDDADGSQLTAGKIRLIQKVIDGLDQGQINPDPVPEP